LQAWPGSVPIKPDVSVSDAVLNDVDKFCCLGRVLLRNVEIGGDITGASVQPAQHSVDLNHTSGMNVVFAWVQ